MGNSLSAIDTDKYLFYVNGISNSVLETIEDDNFEAREIRQISKNIDDKIFIYFSTALVNVKENYTRPYVQHKYKMECLVERLFPNFRIIRTSNLVGQNPWNRHTLFNFLYKSLDEGTKISVPESVVRNILDVEDFITLFNYYLQNIAQKNSTINIVNPISYRMGDIVKMFENIFDKKFHLEHSEIEIAQFDAPCDFSNSLVNACKIKMENYLPAVIKKYYPPANHSI